MQGVINNTRLPVDVRNNDPAQGYNQQLIGNSSSPVAVTQQPPPQTSTNVTNRLIPVHINLNRKENMEEHSTIYYNIPGLILRRGQEFFSTLSFNQAIHPDKYQLSIVFQPQTWRNFPVIKIPLNDSSNGWSATIIPSENLKNNQIELRISSSSDALIGKYSLLLEIRSLDKEELTVFQSDTDIYLLFNPWLKEDSCGLLSADQIAEYVMNEHGDIYLGSSDKPQSIPWYFGQFESPVLPTALTLINRVQIPAQQGIDASIILRILASKICSEPGTVNGIFPSLLDVQPLSCPENGYSSSPAILKEYLSANGQSVPGDSGSNWQHAAIFCSLCRSLGIPSRMLTVYNAIIREQADVKVNSNITCPWYLWNECWIRRDDLAKDNSGWQVMDASLIQYDTKTRRLGPCSVAGLKAGTLDLKWDTTGINSLLNGNRRLNNNAENVIQRKILTKSLKNNHAFDDLTSNYISSDRSNQTSSNDDVQIEIQIPDSLKSNEGLTVILKTNNLSNVQRTLTVALSLTRINPIEQPNSSLQELNRTAFYDPNVRSRGLQIPIQSFVQTLRLDPNQPKTIPLKVAENHQVSQRCFDSLLRLNVHAIVKETEQIYRKEKYILNEQNVTMKLFFDDDVIEIGQSAKLNIQINNAPSHSWDHGRIAIDGFGILESFSIRKESPLNKSITVPIKLVPSRLGIGRVYVNFSTDSLCLSPQSILLEVTGLSEKNNNIDNHLQPQSEKQLQREIPRSAFENDQETKLEKTNTQQSPEDQVALQTQPITDDKNEESETNVDNTATVFTAPTDVNNTNETINQQQDERQTEQTLETISTTTEEITKQEDLTPITIAPLQSPLKTTEKPSISSESAVKSTTNETINKEPEKNAIENDGTDEKTELQTTTSYESVPTIVAQTVPDDTKTEESQPLKKTSVDTTTIQITNTEEKNEDEKEKSLNSVSSENTTVEDKKEDDDQVQLSTTPSSDKIVETVTNTATVEEKNEDEERSLSKIPSSDNTIETITKSTTTETSPEGQEVPLLSLSSSDNLISILDKPGTVVGDPLTQPTTAEEKNADDQIEQLETPSSDRTIETITETTTIKDANKDNTRRRSTTPSLDNMVKTITGISATAEEVEDDAPNITSIDNISETVRTATPAKENQEDDRDKPSTTSVLDSTKETISETKQDNKKSEEDKLQQSPSSDTTATAAAETKTVEDNQDSVEAQLSPVPSFDTTVPSVNNSSTIDGNQNDEGIRLSTISPSDNKTETVAETTIVENRIGDDEVGPLATEFGKETKTVEEKKEDEKTKSAEISPLDTLTETPTDATSAGNWEDEKVAKIPNNSSEDIVIGITTDKEKKNDEEQQQKLEKTPSLNTTADTVQNKAEDTEAILPEIPSLDNAIQADTVTTTVVADKSDTPSLEDRVKTLTENQQENIGTADFKAPSRDNTTESPIEPTSDDHKIDDYEKNLANITSLDTTVDTINAAPKVEETKLSTTLSSDNSVETVIDTVTLGDKKVEVETIVLKAPPLANNTGIDTETATTDEKTAEQESELPQILSSSDYHVETVSQPVKIGDKEEEVEIIVLKAGSPDNSTETNTVNQAIEEDEGQLTKPSPSDITIKTADAASEEREIGERQLSTASSPYYRVETVTQTVTTDDKEDDIRPTVLKAPSPENVTDTVVETTAIENNTTNGEKDLMKIPPSDTAIDISSVTPTVQEEKEGEEDQGAKTSSSDDSVDTIIETVTVGDKDEEVETIVLKASPFDNTIDTAKETATNDDETAEQGKNLPEILSSPDYHIETVPETVKIRDKEEEVETIVLKAGSPDNSTETNTVNKAVEEDEGQLTKPSPSDITIKTADASSEEREIGERQLSTASSPYYRVETVTQTVTTDDKEDAVETTGLKAPSPENVTDTVVETTTTENNTTNGEKDLMKIPPSDTAIEIVAPAPTVQEKKEGKESQTAKTSSSDHLVQTIIDTVTVGDKDEEVETIILKASPFDNTADTAKETATNNDETAEQRKNLPEILSSPDYHIETVPETVKIRDKEEEVETIVLKAGSPDNSTETNAVNQAIEEDEGQLTKPSPSDITIKTADAASEEREIGERQLSTASSPYYRVETVTQTVTTDDKEDDVETTALKAPTSDNDTQRLVQTTTIDNKTTDDERDLMKTPSTDTTAGIIAAAPIVQDEKDGEEVQLPKKTSSDNSVETVIDTVTVGDKKIDVETIVLKAPPLTNNTKIDTETATTDDKTAEQESQLPQTLSSSDYYVETVSQPVKIGEKEEEVETIILKLRSPDNSNETNIANKAIEEDEGQLTKTSSLDTTIETAKAAPVASGERKVEESQISTTSSPYYRVETVTQTVTTEEEEDDVETTALKAPSSNNDTETLVQTTTIDNKTTDEEKDLMKIPSADTRAEIVAAVPIGQDEKGGEEVQPPNNFSSDNLVETVIDTVMVRGKKEEVEIIVLKVLPFNNTTGIVKEIGTSENTPAEHDGDLPQFLSSSNYRVETVPQTVKIGDKEEEVETIVLKRQSLEDTTETVAETAALDDNTEDYGCDLPKTPSSDTMVDTINAEPTVEQAAEVEESRLSKTPSSYENSVEKVTETVTTEDKQENVESTVLKSPSLDNAIDTVAVANKTANCEEDPARIPSSETTTETTTSGSTVAARIAAIERELSKAPSLNKREESITQTITSTDKEKDVESTVLKSPSVDNTTETVVETTTIDNKTKIPSADTETELITLVETVTKTVTTEEKEDDGDTTALKTPSLDNVAEPLVETAGVNNKAADQESDLRNIPSLETTMESITAVPAVEESKPFKASSFDNIVDIVSDTNAIKENEVENKGRPSQTSALEDTNLIQNKIEDEGKTIWKVPSLDDFIPVIKKTSSVNDFTTGVEKREDERRTLPETSSFDSTSDTITETITETSTVEEEGKLPKVPSSDTTDEDKKESNERRLPKVPSLDKMTETITTETTMVEEKQLPEITGVEKMVGTPTLNIPVPENIVLDCSFESTPLKLDGAVKAKLPSVSVREVHRESIGSEPGSKDVNTTASSDLQTIQPTVTGKGMKTESVPITPALETLQETPEKEALLSEEPTKTEAETNGESDSSVDNLRSWLNHLLQQLNDVSTSEDLDDWLDECLGQYSTAEETSTNDETTVVENVNSNVLIKKTTVITKTTTTTEDDDPPTSFENSTKTLKHLVHQTAISDEIGVGEEPTLNTISLTTVTPLKKPEEPIEQEFVKKFLTNTSSASSSSSISSISQKEETIKFPPVITITDRTYSSLGDVSFAASNSDDDAQNSQMLGSAATSTLDMLTIKDADSLSDSMSTDMEEDFSDEMPENLTAYADLLSGKILESAVQFNTSESNITMTDANHTPSEQLITIDGNSTSTDLIQSVTNNETIPNKSNRQ